METLAPRALYDYDEFGITQRLPLVSGLFFGLVMGAFALSSELSGTSSVVWAVGAAVLEGALAGGLFGLLFPRLLGRVAKRMNDRLYEGDPTLVPPPEPGMFQYRLPCGWMRTPRHAVGGVLYLGRRGLQFQTHLATPAALRQNVVLEPLEAIQLSLVETPVPLAARIWGRKTVLRIDAQAGERSAQFAIPDAPTVLARLQERMQALRAGAVSADMSRGAPA
jgi:hypothetical protein